MNAAEMIPKAISYKRLPQDHLNNIYSILEFTGKTTVTIHLDQLEEANADVPLGVAVHELFHYVGQENWHVNTEVKGDIVPINAEPRYHRAMLLRELKTSIADDELSLERAKSYYNVWRAKTPEEAQIASDGNEGTATYVEKQTVFLNQLGCGASNRQLQKKTNEWIMQQSFTIEGLQGEGYYFGAIAGFLLDRVRPEWKHSMKYASSPFDLLFSSDDEVEVKDDFNLYQSISAEVNALAGEVNDWVGEFERHLSDGQYARVGLPDHWQESSINLIGQFTPVDHLDLSYQIYAQDQKFNSPTLASNYFRLDKSEMSVAVPIDQSACTNSSTFFLIPLKSIKSFADKSVANEDGFKFSLVATKVSQDGFTYLCPKD